jgi:hypothetical protein
VNHWHSNYRDIPDQWEEELILAGDVIWDIQRIIYRLEQDATYEMWMMREIIAVYTHS